MLVSMPLECLVDVCPQGTSALDLVFRAVTSHNNGDDRKGKNTIQCSRYSLFFDCPSHLFRWRLVLEAWWATAPIREVRSIVALGSSALVRLPSGWDDLPQQLARRVLEHKLGNLWPDVRARLEALGSGNTRDSGRGRISCMGDWTSAAQIPYDWPPSCAPLSFQTPT